MRSVGIAACMALWTLCATGAQAAPQEPVVTNDLVIGRCQDQYAEFGVELIRNCIQEDLAAVAALNAHPPEDRPRIDDCIVREMHQGWTVVRQCVEAGGPPAGR